MYLSLPQRGEPDPQLAHVTKRLRDANGLPIRKADNNHILDMRIYEVEYENGKKSALSNNLIAENTFAQIDKEGNRHVLMDAITDHKFDEAAFTSQDACFEHFLWYQTQKADKKRC